MTINKISFLFLFLFSLNGLYAQQTPENISRIFFEKYQTGKSDSALDYLFSTNKYAQEAKEQTASLKLSLREVFYSSGKYFSNELLTEKKAGNSVVMLTFLVNHEKEPLLFRLSFYKPEKIWQLLNFKFTTKIDEELEEASRAYRFNENIED